MYLALWHVQVNEVDTEVTTLTPIVGMPQWIWMQLVYLWKNSLELNKKGEQLFDIPCSRFVINIRPKPSNISKLTNHLSDNTVDIIICIMHPFLTQCGFWWITFAFSIIKSKSDQIFISSPVNLVRLITSMPKSILLYHYCDTLTWFDS